MKNKYGPILNRQKHEFGKQFDYNHGTIIRIYNYYGINKVLLLLNEHGDPSFLFPNLSSYNINNQLAKFENNLSAGSISVE